MTYHGLTELLFEDYQRTGILPTVDSLLDFRNRLVTCRNKEKSSHVIVWYEDEIRAVDLLLDKHNNK